MRGKPYLIAATAIVLLTSVAFAEGPKKKAKTTIDLANRGKVEELVQSASRAGLESLKARRTSEKSNPSSKEDSEKEKGKSARDEEKGKGDSESVRRKAPNETNDYFIDKDGDGVSDWWEKKREDKNKRAPSEKKNPPEERSKRERNPERRSPARERKESDKRKR